MTVCGMAYWGEGFCSLFSILVHEWCFEMLDNSFFFDAVFTFVNLGLKILLIIGIHYRIVIFVKSLILMLFCAKTLAWLRSKIC